MPVNCPLISSKLICSERIQHKMFAIRFTFVYLCNILPDGYKSVGSAMACGFAVARLVSAREVPLEDHIWFFHLLSPKIGLEEQLCFV